MSPGSERDATATTVVVCVPVRNEAESLPGLLRSLGAQRGIERPLRVVVIANNCTDDTVPLLRSFEQRQEFKALALRIVEATLEPPHAHVGTARRMAMDCGADWLDSDGCPDGVLISTDADAIAPPDWVAANLRALKSADVVGGRLSMETGSGPLQGLHDRIERYWAGVRAIEDALDPSPYDPAPRHGDHTAASLALPVSIYRQAGGLPALPCGEDNALVARIRCLGGRLRHSPAVEIHVSARMAGRVEGGMASEMIRRSTLVQSGASYELPCGAFWVELVERRAALRQAWTGGRDAMMALGLSDADLAALDLLNCPNDIAFVERAMMRPGWSHAAPLVGIDQALDEIAVLLGDLGSRARPGRFA